MIAPAAPPRKGPKTTKGTRRPHPLRKLRLTGRMERALAFYSHLEASLEVSRTSAGLVAEAGFSSCDPAFILLLLVECVPLTYCRPSPLSSKRDFAGAVANRVWSVPMPTLRPAWNLVPR